MECSDFDNAFIFCKEGFLDMFGRNKRTTVRLFTYYFGVSIYWELRILISDHELKFTPGIEPHARSNVLTQRTGFATLWPDDTIIKFRELPLITLFSIFTYAWRFPLERQ